MPTKKTLRAQHRKQRRSLNATQQHHAAIGLAKQLSSLPIIKKAQHIGIYLASDGEISLDVFYNAHHRNKAFYIPKITKHPRKPMRFNRFSGRNGLFTNHFGIKEVSRGKTRDIRKLDVILMPLVAFDDQSNRLGMGGGFYDKVLSFKRQRIFTRQPLLIGVAHNFQQAGHIPTDAWDVTVNMVVTDKATLITK